MESISDESGRLIWAQRAPTATVTNELEYVREDGSILSRSRACSPTAPHIQFLDEGDSHRPSVCPKDGERPFSFSSFSISSWLSNKRKKIGDHPRPPPPACQNRSLDWRGAPHRLSCGGGRNLRCTGINCIKLCQTHFAFKTTLELI